jgi:hypothetical protein
MVWLLPIAIASSIVGGSIYYFSTSWLPSSQSLAQPQMASADPAGAALASAGVEKFSRIWAHGDDPPSERDVTRHANSTSPPEPRQSISPSVSPPKPPQPRRSPEHDATAALQLPPSAPALIAAPSAAPAPSASSPPPATAAAPPSKPIRTLAPDEIALLVKQGERFIATGDLATARGVFQRAAEAGSAYAALALGKTYDPLVLAKLGVIGMSADVEKARSWYRTAASLGSTEARQRLQGLANR